MTIGVTELGYIGLGVKDVNAWKEFACDVIGLEAVSEADDVSFALRLDAWMQRVIVAQSDTDDLEFVGWRVADQSAFETFHEHLQKNDVPCELGTIEEAAERQVLGLIKLKDPSGLQTEIFFGPHVEPALPFYPGRRMHGSFVTGDKGLGHIAINTDQVEACQKFYTRILGMHGGIEFNRALPPHAGGGRLEMHFMACNDRQHSIAFGDLGGEKRLSHLMTESEKMEDVGLTRTIVKEHEIPIFLDLGQHNNDRVFSFYFDTPSGWAWECGWNVADASGQVEWGELPIWGHEHRPPVSS